MSIPSSQEQFLLELINETRLDPLGSAARYLTSYSPLLSNDSRIQAAMDFFGVTGSALQTAFEALTATGPVAWNNDLADAASKHSLAMISAQTQSHQLPGELGLGERVAAEGYNWRGLGENVYAYSESLIYAHAGFMVDWGVGPNGMQSPAGHRINIMNPSFKEVGIDVTLESNPATSVGPMVITEEFGWQVAKLFVLGVAYSDNDGSKFYSMGEGRGDLTVSIGSSSTTSFITGGYSLETTTGAKTITLSGGGLISALTVNTTLNTENIKLDVVNGNTLLTSGSISVEGVIGTVRGLGVRGLSITTGAGDQTLIGTAGNDTLDGGAGNGDIVQFSGARSAYTAIAGGNGVVVISGNGSGSDTISNVEKFRFTDGDYYWHSRSGQLSTTPESVINAAPVTVSSQSLSTLKDNALQFAVSATDADNDPLSYSAGTAGHGTVSGGTGGVFTYAPAAGFSGTDSFNVTVSDGRGGAAQQTINVKVTAVNSAPIPNPVDTATTTVGLLTRVQLSATDPDGDAVRYTLGAPSHGYVADGKGWLVAYVPEAGYVGSDSFTVTYTDVYGATATQTINILISPGNRNPVFSSSSIKINAYKNTAATFSGGATDPDGDVLGYAAFGAKNGTVTIENGVVKYTPFTGFSGSDSFTLAVNDGRGGGAFQAVSVNVSASAPPANRAPSVGAAQAVTGNEDATTTITVAATDQDGDLLTYTAGAAGHGTVAKTTGGTFVYTPTANYFGTDSFTVSVSDGRGGTATQTVNVTVRNVNDLPVVNAAQAVAATTGESKIIAVSASDLDGDTLSFAASAPSHGKVTGGGANGAFTYTPTSGYIGTDSFTVTVDDGKGGKATQTVNLTVQQEFAGTPFRVFLPEGFVGAVGGKGTVFGNEGAQAVTLLDTPGNIAFDLSFKVGGDTIDLPGNAAAYSIIRSGTNAVLSGPNGSYTIPVDTVGMRLNFDDGSRTLLYNATAATMKIGAQAFGFTSSFVTAAAETSPLPGNVDSSGIGRLYLGEGSEAALGGNFNVFGTSAAEHIIYSHGKVSFDPSFGAGGDLISFDDPASDFSAYLAGSSLVLTSADGKLTIPVPTTGLTLDFNGDTRTLRFDEASSQVLVGEQAITARTLETAALLSSDGGAVTTVSGDVGNPASPLVLTLDAAKSYLVTENAAVGSNVHIRNIGEDDAIRITGAPSSSYNFANVDADNDGVFDDLMVTSSVGSAYNELVLLDAVTPNAFVRNSEASAESVLGWNLFTFA